MNYKDFMKKTVKEAAAWRIFIVLYGFCECYGMEKYLHWYSAVNRLIDFINALKLPDDIKLKTLDISAGMGFLPFVLKVAGHDVSLTEVYDEKTNIYHNAYKILGLPLAIDFKYPQSKFIALPSECGTYDLITAVAVAPMSRWNKKDWESFIINCFEHMPVNGRLIISPNKSPGKKALIEYLHELEGFGLFYFTKNVIETSKFEAFEIIKI